MTEEEFKTGISDSAPEEMTGEPIETPELETPDGEPERDPEAEDDGEESGPEAPVDDSPRIHTLTVTKEKTHTCITARFFHEGEGWITRRCTLAWDATAKMVAEALADIRSWA